jgi:hypothetical protein
MKVTFTEAEIEILNGKKRAIASKLGCSHPMVNGVVDGSREVKTYLTKKIYKELQATIEFFQPIAK